MHFGGLICQTLSSPTAFERTFPATPPSASRPTVLVVFCRNSRREDGAIFPFSMASLTSLVPHPKPLYRGERGFLWAYPVLDKTPARRRRCKRYRRQWRLGSKLTPS